MKRIFIFAFTAFCLLAIIMINNCNARSLQDIQRDLDSIEKRQSITMSEYKKLEQKKSVFYAAIMLIATSFIFYFIFNFKKINALKKLEQNKINAIPKGRLKLLKKSGLSDDEIMKKYSQELLAINPLLYGIMVGVGVSAYPIYSLFS